MWPRQTQLLHVGTPRGRPPPRLHGPPPDRCTEFPRMLPAWHLRTASRAPAQQYLSTNKRPTSRHVTPSMRSYPHDPSDGPCHSPLPPRQSLKPPRLPPHLPLAPPPSSRRFLQILAAPPVPPAIDALPLLFLEPLIRSLPGLVGVGLLIWVD